MALGAVDEDVGTVGGEQPDAELVLQGVRERPVDAEDGA